MWHQALTLQAEMKLSAVYEHLALCKVELKFAHATLIRLLELHCRLQMHRNPCFSLDDTPSEDVIVSLLLKSIRLNQAARFNASFVNIRLIT